MELRATDFAKHLFPEFPGGARVGVRQQASSGAASGTRLLTVRLGCIPAARVGSDAMPATRPSLGGLPCTRDADGDHPIVC
jgi:hypothetical protein